MELYVSASGWFENSNGDLYVAVQQCFARQFHLNLVPDKFSCEHLYISFLLIARLF